MSSEVKYIGMDVHKEAIVIAVRDTRGHDPRTNADSEYTVP